MSKLILPAHLTPKQAKQIDTHNATVGEVRDIFVENYGPLAQLVRELCIRQQALEDHCGFTYVPGPDEAMPQGTIDGVPIEDIRVPMMAGLPMDTPDLPSVAEIATDGGDLD